VVVVVDVVVVVVEASVVLGRFRLDENYFFAVRIVQTQKLAQILSGKKWS